MNNYKVLTDPELFDLIKKEDDKAFGELYTRYWKDMYHNACKIMRNEDMAQDIVQEVFISLWNRRTELNIQHVKSYMQQSTRFAVLKSIRSQKVDDQFYSRLRLITTELVEEQPLLFKEQQTVLNQLINELPADCRETFRMSRDEQLTYKQIAQKLEVSEKTVEKRITKSLKFLRENLSLDLCVGILLLAERIK
ncbi:RNA polymerase sigma-70 factor (family 1) [Pedobacter africanus]|uniref:RNA polymerase sigma-70 factor (ECF subfamily) n=1 Tax=Pedobacter africanus TaxID=151894 RepID=A0ACC6L1Z0_9SPHI|nr:RNA polymerase sigma-70 factor [Pedobacter africanus]MDR6785501.1 RNA polymerase sigma-70 factor (ECF subfamily) [Pedobacter africanus]